MFLSKTVLAGNMCHVYSVALDPSLGCLDEPYFPGVKQAPGLWGGVGGTSHKASPMEHRAAVHPKACFCGLPVTGRQVVPPKVSISCSPEPMNLLCDTAKGSQHCRWN